jgi:hypothetical protein
MNNLYVRKNLSSLDKLGGAVAVFLKRGLAVQLQYGVKERDIVVRFHKRLERLYNDDLEAHGAVVYPVQGFVVLDRNKVITSETKMEKSEKPTA